MSSSVEEECLRWEDTSRKLDVSVMCDVQRMCCFGRRRCRVIVELAFSCKDSDCTTLSSTTVCVTVCAACCVCGTEYGKVEPL